MNLLVFGPLLYIILSFERRSGVVVKSYPFVLCDCSTGRILRIMYSIAVYWYLYLVRDPYIIVNNEVKFAGFALFL